MGNPALNSLLGRARGQMSETAQRILVMGNSGAGKSTLTRRLARERGLPAIHLDAHFWRPGWIQVPRQEFRQTVKELAERDRWVMDGTFAWTLDLRIPRAGLIVLCEVHRIVCLKRVVLRMLKARVGTRIEAFSPSAAKWIDYSRPEMTPGCLEQLDWDFYRYIWSYSSQTLPQIAESLERFDAWGRVVVV